MNINEEDFTVASLARLVGSELNVIDKFTEGGSGGQGGPANKLDPRSFLNRNLQHNKPNPHTVKHDGKVFHAGIDEALVQSMYPYPSDMSQPASLPPVDTTPIFTNVPASTNYVEPPVYVPSNNQNEALIKILQSIDKSLKSIDKTEKAFTKLVTHLTKNYSDQNTSQ